MLRKVTRVQPEQHLVLFFGHAQLVQEAEDKGLALALVQKF